MISATLGASRPASRAIALRTISSPFIQRGVCPNKAKKISTIPSSGRISGARQESRKYAPLIRSGLSALPEGTSHSTTCMRAFPFGLFRTPDRPFRPDPLTSRNHEFQSGPDLIDRADLDIDEAKRKRDVAHHDIRKIGRD